MRAVLQRVTRGKVTVGGNIVGEIGAGLLVLLGVTHTDNEKDAEQLLDKVVNLRIFNDAEGKMNISLSDAQGEMLVVSQFTLYADVRRGRRPSFVEAASGEHARTLYEYFVETTRKSGIKVATGEFGAMMGVELINDGPVTIIVDSKNSI